jgi:DNA-binding PadR family transcriptional regulator
MHAHTQSCHPGFFAMSGGPGRGRRGRHGGGPWGFPGHRGPRARRGDVRTALLVLLAEEPRNGYQLMQEIEQRSDGTWRPSPGSVYPALQQLEDEGLVAAGTGEAGRFYEITDAGRQVLADRGDVPAPWDAAKEDTGPGPRELMQLVRAVAMAAAQILQAGDDAQVAQAREVLRDARRSLYRILAEDPPADDA